MKVNAEKAILVEKEASIPDEIKKEPSTEQLKN
jgi:hypothetical protein